MMTSGFVALAGLAIGLAVLLALPVLIVLAAIGLVLKLALFVLFLPFRAIGWGFGLLAGALGLVAKAALLLVGIGALALVVALPILLIGLLPLLPIALIGLVLYLMLRRPRPRDITARPVS